MKNFARRVKLERKVLKNNMSVKTLVKKVVKGKKQVTNKDLKKYGRK